MFGLFKKRSPTVMDGLIRTIYGANPPPKSADLERSITIAHEDLLFERVPLSEVKQRATELFKGPIPYSTHDLAVSAALAFFKSPEYVPALRECQIPARMRVTNWAVDGKVVKLLAASFDEVLYRPYKPQLPEGENRFKSELISRKSEQDDIPRKTHSVPKIRKSAEASQNSSSQPHTESPPSPLAGGNASLKSLPTATEMGRRLAIILMDADDCWRDVCMLRDYKVPGPVATCEMAFARAAVIKDTITRCQRDLVATQMLAGVDQFVAEAFAKEETTAEVLEYYKDAPLAVVAPQTIQLYQESAFWLPRLADVFASRLKVPGMPVIEIAPLFEEVASKAEGLMKGSAALQKLAANGETLVRNPNPPSHESLVQPELSPVEGRTVTQGQSLREFFASFTPRPRSRVREDDAMMTYAEERVRSRQRSSLTGDTTDDLVAVLSDALSEMGSPRFKEGWKAYNLSVAEQAVLKVKDKAEELLKHHDSAGLRAGDLVAAAEQIRSEIKRRSTDLYYAELTDNLRWFPIEPSVMYEIAQLMTKELVHPDAETPTKNRHGSRQNGGRPNQSLLRDLRRFDPLAIQGALSAVSDFEGLVPPFWADRNDIFYQAIIEPMKEALDKERNLRHSIMDGLVTCFKQLDSELCAEVGDGVKG
jgi:hypothetical protein